MNGSRPRYLAVLAIGASSLCALGSMPVMAEGFVTASVGRSDWDHGCAGTLSCKMRDTAGTLRAGYLFSPYFGIEARYFDLGTASQVFQTGIELPSMAILSTGHTEYSAKGGGVDAILSLPIAERFSISAIAGMARTSVNSRSTIEPVSVEITTRATKPYYGLVGAYALSPNLWVSLEAERYRVGAPGGTMSIDLFGAGLSYRFH